MKEKKSSSKIILTVPAIVGYLGCLNSIIFSFLAMFFIKTTKEQLHWSFYIIFSLLICAGLFMIILTKRWSVVVKNDFILVKPILGTKYAFTCNEIISIQRQVKKNRVKSERIVIKTKERKKLIVENSHTSYYKFVSYLIENTEENIRYGFKDYLGRRF